MRRRKNVRSKFVWRRGNAPRVFFVLLALLVLTTRRARHDARAQKMSGGFNSPRASATPTDLAAMATRRGDTALRARERERDLPAFPTDISRASKNEGAKQYADWRFLFKSRSVKTGTEYLANPECVASYDRMISLRRSIPPGTPAADGDPTALLTHEGVVQAEDNQHLYTDIKNAITQRKNVSDIDRTCMTLLRRHENDGVALLKALDEAFAPGTDKTSQSAALEKFAKLRQDAKFTAFIEGLEDARADVISTGCTLPDELVRNKLWAGVRDGPRVLALKAAIETSSEYAGATYDSLRKLLEPAALADEAHEDDDAGTTATFVSRADNGGGGRGARPTRRGTGRPLNPPVGENTRSCFDCGAKDHLRGDLECATPSEVGRKIQTAIRRDRRKSADAGVALAAGSWAVNAGDDTEEEEEELLLGGNVFATMMSA